MRIRCGPFAATAKLDPFGPVWVGAPSRLHSTWSTPEVASFARTSKLVKARNQPLAAALVVASESSTGTPVSIHSGSERQPESSGGASLSTARVLKSSWPCVLIVIGVPLARLTIEPAPIWYSIVTALSASEPSRVTVYGVDRQPAGVATVSLLGGVCASAEPGRPSNAMIALSSRSDDRRRAIVSP